MQGTSQQFESFIKITSSNSGNVEDNRNGTRTKNIIAGFSFAMNILSAQSLFSGCGLKNYLPLNLNICIDELSYFMSANRHSGVYSVSR